MQHNLSMTPAMQEILDALRDLGRANVNELADKSGRAVSTVHKALKAFTDAGLISEVDTGADPAEGVPSRWTFAEDIAQQAADLGDTDTAGQAEFDAYADPDDHADDEESHADPDEDEDVADDDSGDDADSEPAEDDTYREESDGEEDVETDDDAADSENAENDDTDDDTSSDDDEDDDDDDEDDGRIVVTVVQPSRPGDRKIMTIKAVIAEHGDDGATLDEIVAESGIGHPTASRLLTAMEQADAARRKPGTPARWIAGPTKASEVDPNPEPPRCPLCFQVIKGLTESPETVAQVQPLVRPDGTLHILAEDGTTHTVTLPKRTPIRTTGFATAGAVRRTDITVNADGSQPFGKGELERLTFDTLQANAGQTMTPQDIATSISAQLGGRAVSSGAVRNNCGKLGAAGRILMVSESPWAFQFPVPAEDSGDTEQADDTTDEQA
ncbi:winged helix-turn-helix domain-containing protein [Catellatospora sichuanensis]|uniref:winged helix-turn-helix domain-containing protein n=1 Tax=Catellatospora sichuanensis TaxID=1969805 RepID=UPI001182A758|nr:winged helix-turn-helix domain-containing protein [Catellatospora sichuanensis]